MALIDYVAINQWPTAEETLRLLRPHIYVKGSEFKKIISDRTGKIGLELKVVEEIGAKLAFTEDIVFSSSNLLNRYFSNFSQEIREYLQLFGSRYSLSEIQAALDQMASLKVLVIGDTIIDEYKYCQVLGKSSKDPILVLKFAFQDLFAGGIIAVANHVSQFAGQVDLVTVLGEENSREDFILTKLNPRVTPKFFYQPGASTPLKKRFVDNGSFNKLLEVYEMGDQGLDQERDPALQRWIAERLTEYDVVLVADYGHGAISRATSQMLSDKAPFLAVNTQANGGNRGFHTISKYQRADYICLAEHELRLELRQTEGHFSQDLGALGRKFGSSYLVVTLGREGCAVWEPQAEIVKVPAFSAKVVDRVGTGDAFLSLTALAARLSVPGEILGFLGNIIGSLAVEVIGNQKTVDKGSVEKFATALLK
ncbi:MAG: PfkB family carbohydrate kinase [Deltaproteobacteria bacterium]